MLCWACVSTAAGEKSCLWWYAVKCIAHHDVCPCRSVEVKVLNLAFKLSFWKKERMNISDYVGVVFSIKLQWVLVEENKSHMRRSYFQSITLVRDLIAVVINDLIDFSLTLWAIEVIVNVCICPEWPGFEHRLPHWNGACESLLTFLVWLCLGRWL